MTKTVTTTTGKVHLVCLEADQIGIQYQLWYEDHGKFVGCEGWKNAKQTKYELPPRDNPWTIADARLYVATKAAEEQAGAG